MTSYRVLLTNTVNGTVTVVGADDDQHAIELADGAIPEPCGHCSGWNQPWTRDEDTDGWTAYEVVDTTTEQVVWSGPTPTAEYAIRELDGLLADVTAHPDQAIDLIKARLAQLQGGTE